MSVIGLGTWQFGSKDWGYGAQYADVEAARIVERALDLGVNVIDTAEIYGRGNSERIVGNALGERRKEVFLATKVLPVAPTAGYVEQHGRKSAGRLGVDVIDLYQIHWPNPVVPIAQQMEGMRRLQRAGVVTEVGVSNFSLARWRAAEDALGSPVLSNQVQYSLVARKPDADLVPYAQVNDRLVIAYSPLGMGMLSGTFPINAWQPWQSWDFPRRRPNHGYSCLWGLCLLVSRRVCRMVDLFPCMAPRSMVSNSPSC